MNDCFTYEGISAAARELMEESLLAEVHSRRVHAVLEQDQPDIEALSKVAPERSQIEGYYTRVSYLFWMKRMLDAGMDVEVQAEEAEGLCALDAGISEFERQHPPCPRCGARQYSNTAMLCRACRLDFRKRS